jgi:hypothetical protein
MRVAGASESDARQLLDDEGGSSAGTKAALASVLASVWVREPQLVVQRLLPTTLLDRPKRRLFHSQSPESLVLAEDWRRLVTEKWPRLYLWQEPDWAGWLNGLVRARVQVEPRPSVRARRTSTDPGPLQSYARTLFYVGR